MILDDSTPSSGLQGTARWSAWANVARTAPFPLILVVLLYARIVPELAQEWWTDPSYSHGALVPLVAAALVWRRREDLRRMEPRGSAVGLVPLLLGLAGLVVGTLGAEYFATRSSLVLVLAGLVLFHLGREVFRVVVFPTAYLLFMVPLPSILFFAIAFPLQRVAARASAWSLGLLGVPVFLEGNVIHLSRLSLDVTEACSGIRSLLTLAALATVWAFLVLPGLWPRLLLVASVLPIAVVANVGRVIAIALVAQWLGGASARTFHDYSGGVVYLVALVCLVAVDAAVRWAGRGLGARAGA